MSGMMYSISDLAPYLPTSYTIELISEVGSKMWGMDHVNSDHDIFVVYSTSTRNILGSLPYDKTLPCKHNVMINNTPFDFSYMEVGHFKNLLQKGNINAIWGLMSPLKLYNTLSSWIDTFNTIYTTDIIPSVTGIVKAHLDAKVADDPTKPYRCAYRTLMFAINHLNHKGWCFDRVDNNVTVDDCEALLQRLTTNEVHKIPDLSQLLVDLRLYRYI